MSYQVLGGLKVILSKVLEASFLKTIGPFEEGPEVPEEISELVRLKMFLMCLRTFNGPSGEVPEVPGDVPNPGMQYMLQYGGTGLDMRAELMAVRKDNVLTCMNKQPPL